MNHYFRTDTTQDLVETLELAHEFLKQCEDDGRYWKWFIHAMHSATQSTAFLALENGNGFLVQKPRVAQDMLRAHTNNSSPVSPHMDNFIKLIRKSLDKLNLRGSAVPLEDDGHTAALESLDELRDEFTHFNVKSWSVEIMFILDLSSIAASYIEHYTVRTPAILWRDEAHQNIAATAVRDLHSLIAQRCTKYSIK